jgi:hypothetical protein
MGTALRRMVLAVVLTVAAHALAADKNAATPAAKPDYAALAQAGEITGFVRKVDPADKSFRLEIDLAELRGRLRAAGTPEHAAVLARETAHQAARAGQQEGHLLVQEEKALQTRDPLKRLEKLNKVATAAEKLEEKEFLEKEKLRLRRAADRLVLALDPGVHTRVQMATFELACDPDVKVRRLEPPPRLTARGKPKKYTAKELKELKAPDADLVGYHARFADLRAGQVVAVTLGLLKPKDADRARAHRPVATLIVLVEDGPPPAAPTGKDKAK